jgi:hypothetical protein
MKEERITLSTKERERLKVLPGARRFVLVEASGF